MYLTHATLSRELYYFWELVFHVISLLSQKPITDTAQCIVNNTRNFTMKSVKDPNKEHNFFNKNRYS